MHEVIAFYHQSLGRMTRRLLQQHIRAYWPTVKDERVLAVGYGIPWGHLFFEEAERTALVMLEPTLAERWPRAMDNKTCLAAADALPFPDVSFDRILLVHGLEVTEMPAALLGEIWRVLTAEGRLLTIAPNRRGIWSRFEHSPFGHGKPYSARQLCNLLGDARFTPLLISKALYWPPIAVRLFIGLMPLMERVGRFLCPALGGVYLCEAQKQLYGGIAVPVREKSYKFSLKPRTMPMQTGHSATREGARHD